MLPPGHRLVRGADGALRIDRYWRLERDRVPGLRQAGPDEQGQALGAALEEAVRLQMVSDVPLGAFLSGGVDSSILVAMMARIAGKRVRTFSVGFEAEGAELDESAAALRTATRLGTVHEHVPVRGADVRDRVRQIAAGLDQPSVDGVNSFFVSMAARRGVTVAISGTGGDELFAGYPWFADMAAWQSARAARPARALVKRCLGAVARAKGLDGALTGRLGDRLDQARSWDGFLGRYARCYRIFGARDAARLLAPALRRQAAAGAAEQRDLAPFDELPDGSAIERVTGLCLRGYTCCQLLRDIDAVSMAHSLEVRLPYLDTRLVELALSLPDNTKLGKVENWRNQGDSTYRVTGAKRILIEFGRTLLPPDFDLQPKRGFLLPFESWLRGPLREILADALDERLARDRGWLDAGGVVQVRDGFLAGRVDWTRPWLLIVLELWAREVLDGAMIPGEAL
jgi:asparagine synthase (glutamine-hydrolysing)